jgi:hypothetical protein
MCYVLLADGLIDKFSSLLPSVTHRDVCRFYVLKGANGKLLVNDVDKYGVVELSQAGAQLSKTFRVVSKRLRKKARHIYQRRLGRASQDPGPVPWILKHANKPPLRVSRMQEAYDISRRKLGLDCKEPLLTPGEVVLRWPKALGWLGLWPSWEGPVACDVYLCISLLEPT